MKIVAIKTDTNGDKLIAMEKVLYFKASRPWTYPCKFADYINGTLTIYEGNQKKKTFHPDFKAAIKYIFSL